MPSSDFRTWHQYKEPAPRRQRWLGAALGACLGLTALAQSAPAPTDQLRFAVGTLFKISLSPALPVAPAAGPSAKLPASVAFYLKPSAYIDSQNPMVLTAARKVLGRLQGCKLPAEAVLASQAVDAYLEEALAVELEEDYAAKPSTEWRLAWPKASQILRHGAADRTGRERAKVAILRAMKVPARLAWARGEILAQYWQPGPVDEDRVGAGFKPARSGSARGKAKAPSVAGQWLGEETLLPGELIDAWSLESGDLQRLHWAPAQELSINQSSLERAYYRADEEALARAALAHVRAHGSLPPEARGRYLPRERLRPGKPVAFFLLSVQRYSLLAQGAINSGEIEALLPYRAHLASWGAEPRPSVDELRPEGLAFWSDRPARLRLRADGTPSEGWASPPPALGVLRVISFRLRQPNSQLQARVEGRRVSGHALRTDNLAPRPAWALQLRGLDGDWSVQAKTDAAGAFDIELPAKAKGRLELSSLEVADKQKPDSLVLDLP